MRSAAVCVAFLGQIDRWFLYGVCRCQERTSSCPSVRPTNRSFSFLAPTDPAPYLCGGMDLFSSAILKGNLAFGSTRRKKSS